MKIPQPDNPQHIDNLTSIELLLAQDFKGTDATLSISLFEYGMAWREVKDEFLFIHRHPSLAKRFDRCMMKQDTDVRREFDWVQWDSLMTFLGAEMSEWIELPLPQKLFDLVNFYGIEEIFGSSYWEGFKIKE